MPRRVCTHWGGVCTSRRLGWCRCGRFRGRHLQKLCSGRSRVRVLTPRPGLQKKHLEITHAGRLGVATHLLLLGEFFLGGRKAIAPFGSVRRVVPPGQDSSLDRLESGRGRLAESWRNRPGGHRGHGQLGFGLDVVPLLGAVDDGEEFVGRQRFDVLVAILVY